MSHRALLPFAFAAILLGCGAPTTGPAQHATAPPVATCPKPEPHVPSAASSAKVALGDARIATDVVGAIDAYLQATEADDQSVGAFVALGRALVRADRMDDAAQALRRAAFLEPHRGELWHELGSVYAYMGLRTRSNDAWLEAREVLRRCVEVAPVHPGCRATLGTTLLFLDDEQGALNAYTQSLELDPTQIDVYVDLASLYLNLDYAPRARAVAEQGLSFAPASSPLRVDLFLLVAQACRRDEDFEAMVSTLERASELAADRPEILFDLGVGYLAFDPPRKDQAREKLRMFFGRACKAALERRYREQCYETMAWLAKLEF